MPARLTTYALAGVTAFGGCGGHALHTASPVPVLGSVTGEPLTRPSSLSFGGDGSFYVTGLTWSRWSETAAATGRAHQNDCVPFCAKGHYHVYRVTVRLSRPMICSNGRLEYTRISYRFVSKKPARIAALHRFSAPLGVHPHCP